ncbi:hypothetical protein [Comamonas sp. JC664]|uniref:hypothetical protein n=1 Tax=Comamonas sp. JC664 TaxID=2801917 RepID=UPI00174AAF4E|nr:hypothetical protein [Comamonas sp. JC664]MBL0698632.1 hypothetical protein [Comamonas sp. JC664]GHG78238.1 hypothetical protein GCM10012319_28560 [Comamonas sp. KCTC 72670]
MNPRMAPLVMSTWLLACGGAEPQQLSYVGWAERSAASVCAHTELCGTLEVSRDQCEADLFAAYAEVEATLARGDTGAKAGCVQCMRIRAEEFDAATASGCQQVPNEARLLAVCGEGNAACAGVP